PRDLLPQRAGILLEHINTPEARAVLKNLRDNRDPPPLTAKSPDGTLEARVLPSRNNTVSVTAVATGKTHFEWQHKSEVRSIAFSPDGNRIAAAGTDGEIKLVDGHKGKLVRTLPGHTAPVTELN